jgi:hypothetical protein
MQNRLAYRDHKKVPFEFHPDVAPAVEVISFDSGLESFPDGRQGKALLILAIF